MVLQSSQRGCLCRFLKSFGSISMPARDEGIVPATLLFSSLIYSLKQFAVPQRLTDAAYVSNLVA